MTDKEIYQQIDEYSEEATAFYEKIHEQVESSIIKHAQTKKRRKKLLTGILSVVAVVIVTLAIVLPIVTQPKDEEIRYTDLDVILPDKLDCNLKEYAELNNLSILYPNWYEYADDLTTERYYVKGKENETVYLRESFIDGNWGYPVQLTVMKRNIVVENLEEVFDEPQTTNISNTQIVYALIRNASCAKFEYQGYKYYLEIKDEITLDFLVETIESMFNN